MARIVTRGKGEVSDWGLVVPIIGPAHTLGVVAGAALVDPKSRRIPVPVINPGDSTVNLLADTRLGLIQPVSCLLYTSPSPRDRTRSRMPSSA